MKKTTYWLGLLAALSLPSAHAVNQKIRALFQPDPAQPAKNVFVNKTPNSGYCASYPAQCEAIKMFSIQIPVRFDSTRSIMPGDAVSLKVPANWRQLTVVNQVTQETEIVEVRIIGIGSHFVLSDTAANLVGVPNNLDAHNKLWTSRNWAQAPAPCQISGVGWYYADTFGFFWKSPREATCTKVAAYRIPSMYFNTLDFTYELRTPNPLGMSSGQYTGSLTYTLGPEGDFQMGAMMVPNDSTLTLDFVLDVGHELKVHLPPGGNNVSLEPEGGWQRWMDSGRKPGRIYRDQLYYLSASSRFKVMMLCNSLGGTECALGSSTGRSTKVEVTMTTPRGIVGPGGSDGWSGRLVYNTWIGPFQPTQYLDRKAGNLRFEIPPWQVDFLLKPGINDTLKGNITIIWDSEV